MENKTIKLLVTFCLLLVTIQCISAQQVYKQETEVDLKVPCFNNNSYCSSSSVCNITVIGFAGGALVDNKVMTQQAAFHNYTLNTSDTGESGEYRVSVVCTDAGIQGHSTFEYIITPTGKASSVSSSIVQGLIMILMFGVTIFFLMFSSNTEAPGVKLFFNVISYITMFLTVGTGYILLQSSEVQSNISATMNGLLYIVGIVLVIIMYYIFINQTKYALELMKIKRGYGSEYDNPNLF